MGLKVGRWSARLRSNKNGAKCGVCADRPSPSRVIIRSIFRHESAEEPRAPTVRAAPPRRHSPTSECRLADRQDRRPFRSPVRAVVRESGAGVVLRSSNACPAAARSSRVFVPMNPGPPVMRIFIPAFLDQFESALRRLASAGEPVKWLRPIPPVHPPRNSRARAHP